MEPLKDENTLTDFSGPNGQFLVNFFSQMLAGLSIQAPSMIPLTAIFGIFAGCGAQVIHQSRINSFQKQVTNLFNQHAEYINRINENQYKIIAECIAAALNTVNQEKLNLLRNIISETVTTTPENYLEENITATGRAIRDISIEEAKLLNELPDNASIKITKGKDDKENAWSGSDSNVKLLNELPDNASIKIPKGKDEKENAWSGANRSIWKNNPICGNIYGLASLGLLADIGGYFDGQPFEITQLGISVKKLLKKSFSD